MSYVGIDISKDSFVVAFSSAYKSKTITYQNDDKGIEKFINTLDKEQHHCVMEATGNYGVNLLYHLCEQKIKVSLRVLRRLDLLRVLAGDGRRRGRRHHRLRPLLVVGPAAVGGAGDHRGGAAGAQPHHRAGLRRDRVLVLYHQDCGHYRPGGRGRRAGGDQVHLAGRRVGGFGESVV